MDTNIELSAVDDSQGLECVKPLNLDHIEGRPSVIHDYCEDSIKAGFHRCIWICMKDRGKWIAKDIPILEGESQTIGVYKLRAIRGWWKQHSLFSATGVKEVKICFIDFDKLNNGIGVAVADLNYERLGKELDELIVSSHPGEVNTCGVNSMGQSHDSDEFCPNVALDGSYDGNSTYCTVQYTRRLRIKRDNYEFVPSMLEYYWQKGIKKNELEFLDISGFITTYKRLKMDSYMDAANPYGKTIYAFQLVEGWRTRYILCLIAISLVCSICVVGITTAAHQSFEVGLTVGSYVLGFATILLAVVTLFSAIL